MTRRSTTMAQDSASEAAAAGAPPEVQPAPGLLVRDGSYVIERGDFVRIADEGKA